MPNPETIARRVIVLTAIVLILALVIGGATVLIYALAGLVDKIPPPSDTTTASR
jgi:hypothetical protein